MRTAGGENLIDHTVRVAWRATSDLSDDDIRSSVDQLSPEELSRFNRFVFERDRRDFAAAHALLRRCLSLYGDRKPSEWTFASDPNGKPRLTREHAARTRLVFNLSHTSGMVACIIGRDIDVGIDIEAIDRGADVMSLAERLFAPDEVVALHQLDEEDRKIRFIEVWTLKEAFVKALGEGLSHALDSFAFAFDNHRSLRFNTRQGSQARSWCFALFAPTRGHRMAVAVGSDSTQLPDLHTDPPLLPVRAAW